MKGKASSRKFTGCETNAVRDDSSNNEIKKVSVNDKLYVDGALLNHYPIDYF